MLLTLKPMNEHEIEIWVERAFDRLDALFMRSDMTQAEYDAKAAEIGAKAKEMEGREAVCAL